MNTWFIVHDIQAYSEGLKSDGSNTIGFEDTTHNVNNIEPEDMIVYYLKGNCAIKGIYKVKHKPWKGVDKWAGSKQIDIAPIIELNEPCNFKEIISSLELFQGLNRWQGAIQGKNGIRSISAADFIKIEKYVRNYSDNNKKEIDYIFFPPLKADKRDREFKNVPERQRDEIIYKYLFEGKSHRWLDENIVNEDPDYTRGYISMGVLHYLGIMVEHKGIFDGQSVEDAITILLMQGKKTFKTIISALLRYSEEIYSDDNLDFFHVNEESPRLIKNVGISQYSDGVRINEEFHSTFNSSSSPYYSKRGETRPILVLFNNKVFNAEYRFEDQDDKTRKLQSIRFMKELKEEFKKVFPEPQGRFYIQTGRDLNHFIFTIEPVFFDDENNSGDEEEYSEGNEDYRLHRTRERNPKVIKKAKDRFYKKHGRFFCEVCGFDFLKIYGERGAYFIEGHHTKMVSEMKAGEKTKVEDIALLCANCHRMVHKKPFISVMELTDLLRTKSNDS